MGNKRVKVIAESKTGKNIKFHDNRLNRNMTDKQFISRIEKGEYSNYHVRERDGVKYAATNPDATINNNLG
ncbi:DUF3892 domain-containing protein [Shewanella donghaensis]|uniref:DUF3892 domain-containing protein n=1 Tax=Shewanella donghaensis TaxID=238836 RepID=UPI0011841302|nr:DUF3892 domain-containing protein [Shewanella donghaensis]